MKFLGFNRVLCLSPHPDDIEYSMGGTIIRHSNTQFDILCLTQGGDYDVTTDNSRLNEARNSWIANITSLGEGWHNNHHAMPWKLTQGIDKWQIDPPAWIIKKFLAKDVVENLDKNEKVYSN